MVCMKKVNILSPSMRRSEILGQNPPSSVSELMSPFPCILFIIDFVSIRSSSFANVSTTNQKANFDYSITRRDHLIRALENSLVVYSATVYRNLIGGGEEGVACFTCSSVDCIYIANTSSIFICASRTRWY